MTLLIPKEEIDDEEFAEYLIDFIPTLLKSKISLGKTLAFDNKVNKAGLFQKKFNSKKILIDATYNLDYKKTLEGYSIFIIPNIYIPEYDKNLDILCKFITYGNTEIKGYDILLQTFKEILDDLDKYIYFYKKNI